MRARKEFIAAFTILALIAFGVFRIVVGDQNPAPLQPAALSGASPNLVAPVAPYTTAVRPRSGGSASDLLDYVRGLTGKRFGGMWLAQAPNPSFRVAVVRLSAADRITIGKAFDRIGTPGDVVPAEFSEQKLVQINTYLGGRLDNANRKAPTPLSVGLRPDLNAVQISAPELDAVTPAQRQFVEAALKQFGAAVKLNPASAVGNSVLPCREVFCDPPLRAGNWNYTSLIGCTGSFLARSKTDGKLYQMTAGHCRVVWNATWLTDLSTGVSHRVGPIHNSRFNLSGDMGITTVNDPVWWKSRAWVSVRAGSGTTTNEHYPILTDASSVVGIRVCMSGAGSRSSNCGIVKRVGVTVTYSSSRVTVSGLVESSLCSVPGDSGSPVFAGGVAYGVVSGNSGNCRTYYEPVLTIERLMNVNVAHDAH